MLPEELTLTEEDLEGPYYNSIDCWIARALKRAGVLIDDKDGYAVSGGGKIIHNPDYYLVVGIYKWEDGELFGPCTQRTGKLVLHAV